MNRPIVSPKLFSPKGLFTHAIATEPGRLLHSSGFLARDAATGAVGPAGDIGEQTRRVFDAIGQVLAEAGAGFQDIIKMTVYVSDRSLYVGMNAVRREMLAGCHYASTTVIADLVDADALVEVDVIARLP